ncbi:hypothetical protein HK102_005380, partial [Quaeritorhiza haematococci]
MTTTGANNDLDEVVQMFAQLRQQWTSMQQNLANATTNVSPAQPQQQTPPVATPAPAPAPAPSLAAPVQTAVAPTPQAPVVPTPQPLPPQQVQPRVQPNPLNANANMIPGGFVNGNVDAASTFAPQQQQQLYGFQNTSNGSNLGLGGQGFVANQAPAPYTPQPNPSTFNPTANTSPATFAPSFSPTSNPSTQSQSINNTPPLATFTPTHIYPTPQAQRPEEPQLGGLVGGAAPSPLSLPQPIQEYTDPLPRNDRPSLFPPTYNTAIGVTDDPAAGPSRSDAHNVSAANSGGDGANSGKPSTTGNKLRGIKNMYKRIDQDLQEFARKKEAIDVAFLLDITGTMKPWLETALQRISEIIQRSRITWPTAIIRVAFVGYADFDHKGRSKYYVHDFTEDADDMVRILNEKVEICHGFDCPEDVAGGLAEVLNLTWWAKTKVLIHIADDTPHGSIFHDYGPDGD